MDKIRFSLSVVIRWTLGVLIAANVVGCATDGNVRTAQQRAIALAAEGNEFHDQAEYERALEKYQQALTLGLPAFGEHHAEIATYHHNIGIAYAELKRSDEAVRSFQESMKIERVLNGDNSPGLGITARNLADLAAKTGDYELATENYLLALNVDATVYGTESTEIARLYGKLADTYQQSNQTEDAISYLERELEVRRKIKTNLFNPAGRRIEIHASLGELYFQSGDYQTSIRHYSLAILNGGLFGSSLLVTRPLSVELYSKLGESHIAAGDVDKGIRALESALRHAKKNRRIFKDAIEKLEQRLDQLRGQQNTI